MVKETKHMHMFFDNKIQKIVSKNCGSWELMSWIKKYKLLAIEAIQYNGQLCIELNNL